MSDRTIAMSGRDNPKYLFLKLQPNNASAVIGVTFGGCGNNLTNTTIITNPNNMYSLLFIACLTVVENNGVEPMTS